MPMKPRPPASPRSSGRSTPWAMHGARRERVARDAGHAREVVAAPAGQHAEHAAVGAAQRVGDGADEPVARQRHRDLAGGGRGARQVARVLDVARALGVERDAERAQRSSTPGSTAAARPPPACGLTMRETRRLTAADIVAGQPSTRSASVGATRVPGGAAWIPAAPVSTIAPSMPAARAARGRRPAGRRRQRAARAEAVQRGPEEVGRRLADVAGGHAGGRLDRSDDRAGPGPRAVGHREGRVAAGAQQVGAERTACTAARSSA